MVPGGGNVLDREQIVKLLEEHKAKLIREGNHLVYRLPNGRNFVMSKTPSDYRSESNNYSILRRELGLERPEKTLKPEVPRDQVSRVQEVVAQAEEQTVFEGSIQQRILAEKARVDYLLEEAAKAEKNIALLENILVFANEVETEDVLRSVLGAHSPVVTPMPAPATQTSGVTNRLQITGQLVVAATQTFDGQFTTTDVMRRMLGDREQEVSPDEQRRIRSSIINMLNRAVERGDVKQISAGIGKRQAVYEKVPPKAITG